MVMKKAQKSWRVVSHGGSNGFVVRDFRTKNEAVVYGNRLSGSGWRLIDMRGEKHRLVKNPSQAGVLAVAQNAYPDAASYIDAGERRIVRALAKQGRMTIVKTGKWRKRTEIYAKLSPSEVKMQKNPEPDITLYANPYDVSASGWYFNDAEDFDKKFKKKLPVEEYEIEWIDGPEADRALFEALNVNQANLHQFFELIDDLDDHDKPALYYLLRHRGMGKNEDLDDMLQMVEDEVRVREGDTKEYVYDYIDDMGGVGKLGKQTVEMYFDYESFGNDMEHDLDADDERDRFYLDMRPQERAEEYIDDMGGVSELGKQAEQYFDHESFARDMELNGDVTEFDFAGTTYTTDFRG